jgi:hypothetical protein
LSTAQTIFERVDIVELVSYRSRLSVPNRLAV